MVKLSLLALITPVMAANWVTISAKGDGSFEQFKTWAQRTCQNDQKGQVYSSSDTALIPIQINQTNKNEPNNQIRTSYLICLYGYKRCSDIYGDLSVNCANVPQSWCDSYKGGKNYHPSGVSFTSPKAGACYQL
ncbi:hypothetical protein CSPX01_08911 [Colletotrichum filicis]|nr:hypothetical protein CSPX01_08911 [Colletotrichum filicis]